MSLSSKHWSEARATIRSLLTNVEAKEHLQEVLIPMSEIIMHLPARIGDYTDFYSSLDHATNVGTMFRFAFLLPKLMLQYELKTS